LSSTCSFAAWRSASASCEAFAPALGVRKENVDGAGSLGPDVDPRDVEIKDPCPEDWDAMRTEPGSPRRHCDHCAKNVHDLSAMTEAEAELFLTATRGQDLCVSYALDGEGAIAFRAARSSTGGSFVPATQLRRRLSDAAPRPVARAAVKTAMAGALAACAPHGEPQVLEMDAASESTGVEAAIYDEPRIPEQTPPSVGPQGVEQEPCDDESVAPATEKRHRTLGRRPLRKKGKFKTSSPPPDEDARLLGFL